MFGDEFVWGAASASYQVEGRGEGLKADCSWDDFARRGGTLFGHNGDMACDQFHRYVEDIRYMKEMGIKSYRLSISWPRIFPESSERECVAGFDYYHRLIDELKKNGIEAHVCLHHWDVPMYLMDNGGWCNRETVLAFERYVESVFRNLGEKVSMWSTILEPWCIAFLGYEHGEHAPGIVGEVQKAYDVAHHLNLGHGVAVRKFRELGCSGSIGAILNLMYPRAATGSSEDILAARKAAEETYYLFTDPIFRKEYPEDLFKRRGVSVPVCEGDMDIIGEKIDFLGINYYTEDVVAADPDSDLGYKKVDSYHRKTAMGWSVVPEGLYRLIKRVRDDYGDEIPLYITENGCAYFDRMNEDETRVHDPERIEFYREHLVQIKRLLEEGANIKGYYAWTLLDNFEWAFGYTRRFGLIYVDYQDMRRMPKDSYYFMREVISGNEML